MYLHIFFVYLGKKIVVIYGFEFFCTSGETRRNALYIYYCWSFRAHIVTAPPAAPCSVHRKLFPCSIRKSSENCYNVPQSFIKTLVARDHYSRYNMQHFLYTSRCHRLFASGDPARDVMLSV